MCLDLLSVLMRCRWIFLGTFSIPSESWFCFLQGFYYSFYSLRFYWAPFGVPAAFVSVVHPASFSLSECRIIFNASLLVWTSYRFFSPWLLLSLETERLPSCFSTSSLSSLQHIVNPLVEQKAETTHESRFGAHEESSEDMRRFYLILFWSFSLISH